MGRGLDGYLISVHWHCVVLKAHGEARSRPVSGGYGEGETPLPIPNRAVKPLSADGTWPARAWESRSPPVFARPRRHGGVVLRVSTGLRSVIYQLEVLRRCSPLLANGASSV
jgi:hypothetical protein